MLILSNGFPTNLPDSNTVSQGGPANFARLFINYILSSNMDHKWMGVMLEGVNSREVRMEQVFSSNYRSYYRLYTPRSSINKVTQAKSKKTNPALVWEKPIKKLVSLIAEQKPDVVFLNGFGILNWMLLQAARETDTPVVIQHAGIWTKELAIHKDFYSAYGRELMENMEKDSTTASSVEIFLNRWSREYYWNNVAKGELEKTKIIPLPFDFISFKKLLSKKSSFAFHKKFFHIGVIARWDEIKNHDAVLAMAKIAHKEKLPWKFHSIVDMTGAIDQKKSKEYRKYVDVLPPVDRAGVSDFCRSVDLLLLPSLFDVSPTVVLEAMALNTPIAISTTVGYVEDFMSYGGKDWVIDPADPREAVQALLRIAGKKMPVALRRKIMDMHEYKKVFSAYVDLFETARRAEPAAPKTIKTLLRRELEKYLPILKSSRKDKTVA